MLNDRKTVFGKQEHLQNDKEQCDLGREGVGEGQTVVLSSFFVELSYQAGLFSAFLPGSALCDAHLMGIVKQR